MFNTKLEDDLHRARELAETAKTQYEKLQVGYSILGLNNGKF